MKVKLAGSLAASTSGATAAAAPSTPSEVQLRAVSTVSGDGIAIEASTNGYTWTRVAKVGTIGKGGALAVKRYNKAGSLSGAISTTSGSYIQDTTAGF